MGKKGKTTRLPMTRRIIARIRYHKRLQHPPRRKRKQVIHCSCRCGATKNLTSGWSGGNLRWLCPAAAAEANNPRM
ncbi:hypothetical protein LCGC14_1358880 [marine sediment metagenome]|uniref:Uncharacterized protein n=1 Tax=marine sediment metagenome TaxID=412755 RepID=A0A0F9MP30_9ZZZZ